MRMSFNRRLSSLRLSTPKITAVRLVYPATATNAMIAMATSTSTNVNPLLLRIGPLLRRNKGYQLVQGRGLRIVAPGNADL